MSDVHVGGVHVRRMCWMCTLGVCTLGVCVGCARWGCARWAHVLDLHFGVCVGLVCTLAHLHVGGVHFGGCANWGVNVGGCAR